MKIEPERKNQGPRGSTPSRKNSISRAEFSFTKNKMAKNAGDFKINGSKAWLIEHIKIVTNILKKYSQYHGFPINTDKILICTKSYFY